MTGKILWFRCPPPPITADCGQVLVFDNDYVWLCDKPAGHQNDHRPAPQPVPCPVGSR